MEPNELDEQIRLAAFEFLREQRKLYGETIPRAVLQHGFEFEGRRVPLVGPQGIFKPAVMPEMPLSLTTAFEGPYDDEVGSNGLIMYRYRGTDPNFHENVRLRTAMARAAPLVYFSAKEVGEYAPLFPVYVVADDPAALTVTLDTASSLGGSPFVPSAVSEPERAYAAQRVRRRLHQAEFAAKVMRAYERTCAVCKLHRRELLDAAHIVPDRNPKGEPTVRNGLSLCKLHHAAFDNNIVGIRPDLMVEVRQDILDEIDGPMLLHGLQGLHNQPLMWVPRRTEWKPGKDFLEQRYEAFRAAG